MFCWSGLMLVDDAAKSEHFSPIYLYRCRGDSSNPGSLAPDRAPLLLHEASASSVLPTEHTKRLRQSWSGQQNSQVEVTKPGQQSEAAHEAEICPLEVRTLITGHHGQISHGIFDGFGRRMVRYWQ